MPKITPQIVEELKGQVDIVSIIDQYVPLRQRGNVWLGVCPFHDDRSPSMNVTPTMGIYKCFACGAGGDIFKFLMEHERIDFVAAVEIVANECGYTLPDDKPETPQQKAQREKFSIVADANEMAAKWFQLQLQRSTETMNYLKDRGVENETIQKLRIGWAPDSWDSLISAGTRQGVSKQDLIDAGLVKEKDNGKSYDAFRGRLIFPIESMSHKVIAFGGRTLINDPAKYYNSPETALYSKSNSLYGLNHARKSIATTGEVIFVEGYFDFLQLFQSGIENVVSVSGTALTPGHAQILKRFVKKAYLVFDGDEAGKKAARRSISILLPHGIETKILLLPDGEDPDTMVKNQGPEKFRARLYKSLDFIDFTLEDNEYLNLSPEEKSELVVKLKELINLIPNKIVQSEYIRKAATRLNISENLISKTIVKSQSPKFQPKLNRTQAPVSKSTNVRLNPLEARFITLVLQNDFLHKYALATLDTNLISQVELAHIIDYALALLEEKGVIILPVLYTRLPENLREIYAFLPQEEWTQDNAFLEYADSLLQLKINQLNLEKKDIKNSSNLSHESLSHLIRIGQEVKALKEDKIKLAGKKISIDDVFNKFKL